MNFKTNETHFENIFPIWKNDLWPARNSMIEPISLIDHEGKIDISIKEWSQPRFLTISIDDQIVAVTSFYQTGPSIWRLRGTWIQNDFRNHGLGRKLIDTVIQEIKKKSNESYKLWSMARSTSLNFYLKNGFVFYKDVCGYEYGPHVIVFRNELISNS